MEHLDGNKHVLLSSLDCTLIQNNSEFNLGIHKYEGDNYIPKGHKYIEDFKADLVLQIFYKVGDVSIVRESLLIEKEQQMLIRYTVLESDKPTKLKFTPFLAFRNVHHLSKSNLHAQTKVKFIKNGVKAKLYDGYPFLHMQFSKPVEFVPTPDWYYNIEYLEEQRRGYEYKEDLFVPGFFELTVKQGEAIIFSASTTLANPDILKRKYTTELNKRIKRDSLRSCLSNSAEQFIVKKDKETEILAGYHWFGSHGRDTFIALPGLTFPSKDFKTFLAVIDTQISRLNQGIFPNVGSDDDALYNTADASLWFFRALQLYCKETDNSSSIWKNYGETIKSILKYYKEGTHYNIHMLPNGLIYAGEHGKAVTWMDSVINGKPVTARMGCAVEINALWYNAVKFALELAEKENDTSFIKKWKSLPDLISKSFIDNFWDNNRGYLCDYFNEEYKDWSIRPNQVIATSLIYTPLTEEMISSIIDIVKRDLLTPRGLRSLAPSHREYIGKYEGTIEQRDLAFHQGTVWPWLLEHYCTGYARLHKKSSISFLKKVILDFEPTMSEHGIGSISQIYDGDPPHLPRGAISQAINVAALLNIVELFDDLEASEK